LAADAEAALAAGISHRKKKAIEAVKDYMRKKEEAR
jgi:imidazole glycerol phosphate synthase subunit HisF